MVPASYERQHAATSTAPLSAAHDAQGERLCRPTLARGAESLLHTFAPCGARAQVTGNPTLSALFDDPEVTKAVEDVAKNPGNFSKYKNNAKVVQFYSLMGQVCGEKLQQAQPGGKPPAAAKGPAPPAGRPSCSITDVSDID